MPAMPFVPSLMDTWPVLAAVDRAVVGVVPRPVASCSPFRGRRPHRGWQPPWQCCSEHPEDPVLCSQVTCQPTSPPQQVRVPSATCPGHLLLCGFGSSRANWGLRPVWFCLALLSRCWAWIQALVRAGPERSAAGCARLDLHFAEDRDAENVFVNLLAICTSFLGGMSRSFAHFKFR